MDAMSPSRGSRPLKSKFGSRSFQLRVLKFEGKFLANFEARFRSLAFASPFLIVVIQFDICGTPFLFRTRPEASSEDRSKKWGQGFCTSFQH